MSYTDYDAIGLATLIQQREVSAGELLTMALRRVGAVNPALNAVVLIQEERAREIINETGSEGPFAGVPFVLKDLGAAAIDFPSHRGSRLTQDTKYLRNSTLYERMAKAGLVTLGRTTSPESGIGATTESAVYGRPTRNPWDLSRSPGGSSGGAAAAVAAGIVPAAHASDGGGSIRIPASCCGLFGFKPSRGRLPKGPDASEGWGGMAIDGFLSRSVRDSALLLDETAGFEPGAPYCAPPMAMTYTESLDVNLKPLRIAVCDTTFSSKPIHSECAKAVALTANLLENMGHEVELARPEADHMGMAQAWMKIVSCGVALDIRNVLAERGGKMTPDNTEGVTRGAVAFAKNVNGEQYLDALRVVHKYTRDMSKFFEKYDILLTPTLAEPPAALGRFSHESTDFEHYRLGPGMMFDYTPFTAGFNATGQPAASLPLHWSPEGLPIGVQLVSHFGGDEVLMSLCRRIEEAQPWFSKVPVTSSFEDVT